MREDVFDWLDVHLEGVCGHGPESRMGFIDKRIARMVMLGLSNEHGMEIDMKGRNDLRDWGRIRSFAHRFAESLRR